MTSNGPDLKQHGRISQQANHDADEIADLERRLAAAKLKLQQTNHHSRLPAPPLHSTSTITYSPSNHFLLLLSDSALPLGSFAFSSGLESYLAHNRSRGTAAAAAAAATTTTSFENSFLPISISSYAATTLPFVLAAHRDPSTGRIVELDDGLDATLICTVGRRASVAQGRALLGIWERSFAVSSSSFGAAGEVGGVGDVGGGGGGGDDVGNPLREYAAILRSSSSSSLSAAKNNDELPPASAHLGPLFGAVSRLVGLSLEQTAYVFMLSHVKALVSAAVRASMFGPYQAQAVLASPEVQSMIADVIQREWNTPVEEAGQTVPIMDLWVGRHECLYSRIFNS